MGHSLPSTDGINKFVTTSIANSPRPAAEHPPATFRHPSKQPSRSRPVPTCRSAPPERVPSRRRPGPEPRLPHSHLPVDDAVGLNYCCPAAGDDATSSASCSASTNSTSSSHPASSISSRKGTSHDETQRHGFVLRIRSALNGGRAGGPGPSMSARASTSAPQSGHVVGSGSRTSTGELRLAAQALPRHRLPALRKRRRQMRSQQPAAVHVSTARGTTSSVPAACSSQPRTASASTAQRSASIGARTSHLNFL